MTEHQGWVNDVYNELVSSSV